MLIEAVCRLAFRDQTRRPETRSFMLNASEEAVATLCSLKKELLCYGIDAWVKSFGVADYKTSVALKRLEKDPRVPQTGEC